MTIDNARQGLNYVDQLTRRVQEEINTKGARENQGYDQENLVRDAIAHLSCTEQTQVIGYFYYRVDNLNYSKAKR